MISLPWRRDNRTGLWLVYDFRMLNPDGSVKWKRRVVPNRLFNTAELAALETLYSAVAFPSSILYGRLYNTTPVDTSTLTTLSALEMTGNGYAAIAWDRDGTDWTSAVTLGSGEGEKVGVIGTYTASGGSIGPFTFFVMATTSNNSGIGWSYVGFGSAQTIAAGASLQVRPRARLRGVSV